LRDTDFPVAASCALFASSRWSYLRLSVVSRCLRRTAAEACSAIRCSNGLDYASRSALLASSSLKRSSQCRFSFSLWKQPYEASTTDQKMQRGHSERRDGMHSAE
jgi:hypothetical protein